MIVLSLLSLIPAWADAEVTASVHGRAPAGQTVHVMIRVRNPTPEPISYPDLTNRPWLVQFETTDPEGTKRTLFSTPPEHDTDLTWTLAPGGQRWARFEVPTSDAWPVGTAKLRVKVVDTALPQTRIDVVKLEPHHIDDQGAPVDQVFGAESRLLSVAVHENTELWLAEAGRLRPLATVPGKVSAELSVARVEQAIGRWITWTDNEGVIWKMRTQGEPSPLRLPWPKVSQCGRAATDASARLVFPLCVQSPRGEFDQLMAAIVEGNGPPMTRHVSRVQPTSLLTNVNAGGHVDWVLVRPGALDQVQILHTDEHSRPTPVSPLWRSTGSERIVAASWTMADSPAVQTTLNDESEQTHRLVGPR